MQHVTGDPHPVVEEDRLHLRHHQALDTKVVVAPLFWVAGLAAPVVGDAHTPGVADAAVDNQQLAVGAVVELVPLASVGLVETLHLHAGLLHLVDQGLLHLQAADPVEQHVNAHASAGSVLERVDEFAADTA